MAQTKKVFCISGEEILLRMQKRFFSLLEKKAEGSREYAWLLASKETLIPRKVTAVRFRINGEWVKPSFLAEIKHARGYLSVIYDLSSKKMLLDNRRLWSRNIKENEIFDLKGRCVKYTQGNIVEA